MSSDKHFSSPLEGERLRAIHRMDRSVGGRPGQCGTPPHASHGAAACAQPLPLQGGAEVLVIKHGALGDFILATGPFQAIRAHHPHARITLMTTQPFEALARASGYFDAVWLDSRPKFWRVGEWMRLLRFLRGQGFARVYDLQTSSRSTLYHRFMPRGTEWSGIAPGCSHPHEGEQRVRMHTQDRQREQLRLAGIEEVPPPDVSWLKADITGLSVPVRFALLVPGGSAHRPEKRWPPEHFVTVARAMAAQGVIPVLLGTKAEAAALAEVEAGCLEEPSPLVGEGRVGEPSSARISNVSESGATPHPTLPHKGGGGERSFPHKGGGGERSLPHKGGGGERSLPHKGGRFPESVINLCGKTSLGQIAELARKAEVAIGNDTGPMHLIAAVGCRSAVLFSAASNPDLCAPRGAHVTVLRAEKLEDLPPERVLSALS